MDVSSASLEAASKKMPLEELSKEDLIKKCKNLLAIAQKAKQAKDGILEESGLLKSRLSEAEKSCAASNEIVENITQQKLELVSSIEDLRLQKKAIEEKMSVMHCKLSELDTENISLKRQTNRLTDENEQLITHLDSLEKKIQQLTTEGLQQQDQLLALEKRNQILNAQNTEPNKDLSELQKMLAISLEKVKHLQSNINDKTETLNNMEMCLKEKDKNITVIGNEVLEKNKQIDSLKTDLDETKQQLETVRKDLISAQEIISVYKVEVHEKNLEIEMKSNSMDDLNTELHKNRALIEILNKDIKATSDRLSNNQIISSGVTSDLQNTNEKLKEKVKLYHSKIVKLASDIKILKQNRYDLLDNFKLYMEQVKTWKEQLNHFAGRLQTEIAQHKKEKELMNAENCQLVDSKQDLEELKQINECLQIDIEQCKREKEQMNVENCRLLDSKQDLEELMQINERLQIDIEQCKREKEEMNVENGRLVRIIEEKDSQQKSVELKQLAEENIRLKSTLDSVQLNFNKLRDQEKILKDQENVLKQKLMHLEEIKNENESLKTQLNTLKNFNEKQSHQAQLDLEEVIRKFDDLTKTYDELAIIREKDLQLAEKSSQEILNLLDQNKELFNVNESQQEELVVLRAQRLSFEDACIQTVEEYTYGKNDLEEQFTTLKHEHHEVLAEMNEMNQALKERGETISKQQAYCDELLKKIQIFEAQLNNKCETLLEKEDAITSLESKLASLSNQNDSLVEDNNKDELIKTLQNEVDCLKERLNQAFDNSSEINYAESENMSTSTISRTDEVNRLKDLEGSWEERYGKLRSLALKLKAKIRSLSSELAKEQAERSDLQQKLTGNIKNMQCLQSQCDKLQDDLETSKNEAKNYLKKLDSLASDVNKDKKQLAGKEETIANLKAEMEAFSKEKQNTENWKKQVSSKVQSLKKELEANTVMRKEFESKINKLTLELEQKEKILKDEREKHKETRGHLEESHNECKKQSVLNLEMQDYERSIKELSQKLDKKQELINKLKNQLENQKSTSNTLKEQNKILEERKTTDSGELETARTEIKVYKTKVNELEAIAADRESKIQEVTQIQENIRMENEELSMQLSKSLAEHQKIIDTLKNEKEILQIEHLGLEQKVRELQEKLNSKHDEINVIKEEYQGYKVRAQSVLRQNQTRDVGIEEKLNEEIASLKAQVAIYDNEIREFKLMLDAAKKEHAELNIERENVASQVEDLKQEVDEYKDKYNLLDKKYQQAILEHAETVRGLKVHADTLSQCYRQQITEQELRHNREVIELQSKLEKGITLPDIPALLLPTMPREEGEGSESVESTSNLASHPLSLEKLLNTDSDHEMSIIKKQLFENESKVTHLTALLADTEQDLVKHVQMNKLLKEEIRRQQRSVEREQHAENLEYLKNVVFKFVTLGNGDERARLVPVLNTILKLSPEETHKLNLVAKGDKSWSTYLPSWSNK